MNQTLPGPPVGRGSTFPELLLAILYVMLHTTRKEVHAPSSTMVLKRLRAGRGGYAQKFGTSKSPKSPTQVRHNHLLVLTFVMVTKRWRAAAAWPGSDRYFTKYQEKRSRLCVLLFSLFWSVFVPFPDKKRTEGISFQSICPFPFPRRKTQQYSSSGGPSGAQNVLVRSENTTVR